MEKKIRMYTVTTTAGTQTVHADNYDSNSEYIAFFHGDQIVANFNLRHIISFVDFDATLAADVARAKQEQNAGGSGT